MQQPTMVVFLADGEALSREVVGGKGASLGSLSHAGMTVPPAFTIATHAYDAYVEANGLRADIVRIAERFDYGDLNRLGAAAAEVRRLIVDSVLPPDVDRAIRDAYRGLGADVQVAVRSSGTAEDLEDASFAGLHDTFLHVISEDDVVRAVIDCWASLWNTQCVAYRHERGHSHADASIAVIVQRMVEPQVSGVMFTANPLTARTDEFVVNATWGLGESIVSGTVTPDEFVIRRDTFAIKQATVGDKSTQVVFDGAAGTGTRVDVVDPVDAARSCMTEAEVAELCVIGQRVLDHYGGIPQDIEWSIADGQVHILQSRAITGVEFTWDEDVEAWQWLPDSDECLWSHAYADEFWTGAITPLFYSINGERITRIDQHDFELWGFNDLKCYRSMKWYRGTAYYNADLDLRYDRYLFPRFLRKATLWKLPPSWREDALNARFSWTKAIRTQFRILTRKPERNFLRWFDEVYDLMDYHVPEADGPSLDELQKMGDNELWISCDEAIDRALHFVGLLRPPFHYYAVASVGILRSMVTRWYDGGRSFIFEDLVSGMTKPMATTVEMMDLWHVASELRANSELLRLFQENENGEFFAALEDSSDGRDWLDLYRDRILIPHGHRGHADRDIWYSRRIEDPSLDYASLRSLIAAGDGPSPQEFEKQLIGRREGATAEVISAIKRTRFSGIKTRLFHWFHAYVLKFLLLRDDERHYMDRLTFAKKKHLVEIGRRLVDSGTLKESDDFYFLSYQELRKVWDDPASTSQELLTRKLANRRQLFERHLARDEAVPMFIQSDRPYRDSMETEELDAATNGVFRGTGVSGGNVTATARVIPDLKEIGRVKKGDVLVCNSTDPGWAPVFAIISGLVLETGGMLAHGSCLAREYNIPAVTVPRAMRLIEDGATVTVNGDAHEVRLEVHDA